MKIWIVVILTGIITQLFRIAGVFIPVPRSPFMDKFLEAIPITVLVVLFFPDIFVSIGLKPYELVITTVTVSAIILMTIKKVGLGMIMLVSAVMVIVSNLILSKMF